MRNIVSKINIITIVGTRPEIIRLSRIINLLDSYTEHTLVYTGQNYDYELSNIFFEELNIRNPDLFMNINNSSLALALGDIFKKSEEIFRQIKPDALLILGDTNSALSAYMAKRMKIPIFHMEAGNRAFDFDVPEEVNRRIIDHISDYNLVYTEHARRHLITEGIPHNKIYLTGSPLKEVIEFYKDRIEQSGILKSMDILPKKYLLASIHREENVDSEETFIKISMILEKIYGYFKMPIILSTHPRTRKRMEKFGIKLNESIKLCKPFGYLDYLNLQKNAYCTISDSGTISEESAILSFPAVTLRKSMERPEAMDSGSIILTGFNSDNIINSIISTVNEINDGNIEKSVPSEYLISNTSWRVLKLILSLSMK